LLLASTPLVSLRTPKKTPIHVRILQKYVDDKNLHLSFFAEPWNLNWFPHLPGQADDLTDTASGGDGLALDGNGRIQMGIASTNCDDAAVNPLSSSQIS
jgi:hypothetical protein